MTRIELSRVSKAYPERPPILDGIDLQVADGEFVVLVGPNGSGKSTLLRMIAGLEPVSAGEIRMDGEIVNHWSPRRRQVALMFQSGVLYPHLTVAANLRMTPAEAGWDSTKGDRSKWGSRIGGWWSRIRSRWTNRSHSVGPRSQVPGGKQPSLDDRVRETARRLSIVSLLDRYPRQLSGGERQRVALGRALVRQPAVFLLDEPFANADSDLRREMRGVLRDRNGQSLGTTILVTHDHAEAV